MSIQLFSNGPFEPGVTHTLGASFDGPSGFAAMRALAGSPELADDENFVADGAGKGGGVAEPIFVVSEVIGGEVLAHADINLALRWREEQQL